MIFRAAGLEPYFLSAPIWVFDFCINAFQWLADQLDSEKFENLAETARIGKYYAVEDMVTIAPEEKFGIVTLQDHYDRIVREGQEYDPFFKNL
jgi:divinyl chlorophyllide a 8-vinyl-reductase